MGASIEMGTLNFSIVIYDIFVARGGGSANTMRASDKLEVANDVPTREQSKGFREVGSLKVFDLDESTSHDVMHFSPVQRGQVELNATVCLPAAAFPSFWR